MKHYLKLIRPEQYLKNVFVFAPLFFGGAFLNGNLLLNVFLAIVAFSLAASSIYIVNDFFDINEDKAHPVKSKRPAAQLPDKRSGEPMIIAVACCRTGQRASRRATAAASSRPWQTGLLSTVSTGILSP